jgi:hypothetical protein
MDDDISDTDIDGEYLMHNLTRDLKTPGYIIQPDNGIKDSLLKISRRFFLLGGIRMFGSSGDFPLRFW